MSSVVFRDLQSTLPMPYAMSHESKNQVLQGGLSESHKIENQTALIVQTAIAAALILGGIGLMIQGVGITISSGYLAGGIGLTLLGIGVILLYILAIRKVSFINKQIETYPQQIEVRPQISSLYTTGADDGLCSPCSSFVQVATPGLFSTTRRERGERFAMLLANLLNPAHPPKESDISRSSSPGLFREESQSQSDTGFAPSVSNYDDLVRLVQQDDTENLSRALSRIEDSDLCGLIAEFDSKTFENQKFIDDSMRHYNLVLKAFRKELSARKDKFLDEAAIAHLKNCSWVLKKKLWQVTADDYSKQVFKALLPEFSPSLFKRGLPHCIDGNAGLALIDLMFESEAYCTEKIVKLFVEGSSPLLETLKRKAAPLLTKNARKIKNWLGMSVEDKHLSLKERRLHIAKEILSVDDRCGDEDEIIRDLYEVECIILGMQIADITAQERRALTSVAPPSQ